MWTRALTTACVLVGGLSFGATSAADTPPPRAVPLPGGAPPAAGTPLDRTELDKRTAQVAYGAALLGSKLWEAANYEGCFRLYQGTLMALLPVLDHRPELAALVRDRLDKVATLDPVKGAFALREALDAVQKETAQSLVPKKTLWERLGGEKAVRAVVHDFAVAAAADPKVNLARDGKYKLDAKGAERLEQLLVEWISKETGGPLKYTGRDMKTAHAGMKITEAEFRALLSHAVDALKKHKVPLDLMVEVVEILGKTKLQVVGQ
ncbi:MAG: group 1 hemoglobin [Gemmataceae bacterium]|nr:group 1 hemoglobin [Gemmataceae bacterium]